MELKELLKPEAVVADLKVTSKKQTLQELARIASDVTGIHDRAIFDVLVERERLGSTGMGHGVAIPHGKLGNLERLHGVFVKLKEPVDFEAIDDMPVDLIFLLLAPEQAGADHLKALATISRVLRDKTIRKKLKGTDTSEALYALLVEQVESQAA